MFPMFDVAFIFIFAMTFIVIIFALITIIFKQVKSHGGKSSVKIIVDGREKEDSEPKELRCPYCGAPIHEDDKKCSYCDARL